MRIDLASEAWPAFAEIFGLLRRSAAGWPVELDLACQWYSPHLERNYDDAAIRQLDLIQLAQIAASYPSRERFLSGLTLDPPDATSDEAGPPLQDEDYLILSTIHSAKGQEGKSVFVLNTVDGCIPADLALGSNQELEEERRLLYVAMTRAKDHLHLMVPQRFFVQQQRVNGDRARLCSAHSIYTLGDSEQIRSLSLALTTNPSGREKSDVAAADRLEGQAARDVELVRLRSLSPLVSAGIGQARVNPPSPKRDAYRRNQWTGAEEASVGRNPNQGLKSR